MWLLNATSKHLKAFLPDNVPAPGYAILSHTWDPDPENEILFSDFEASGGNRAVKPTARLKHAWRKVELACGQALVDSYAWIWIDTCCIDKSSSSELSEAINSMYAWYRDSGVCYAWLSDLSAGVDLELADSDFRASRWFTRGWTLQELLAPQQVVFFIEQHNGPDRYEGKEITGLGEDGPGAVPNAPGTAMWLSIGEKTDLSELINSVTGIDPFILRDLRFLESASIAQRMSWASNRVTSRPEDTAYCLMGIFDVNMPMLYGEGAEKAFLRLQEEIMKSSDDQSLFAWRDDQAHPESHYGLLAASPRFFRGSNSIIPYQHWASRPPYAMTNRGLQITLPLIAERFKDGDKYWAELDCPVPPDYNNRYVLAICLEKVTGPSQFARVLAGQFGTCTQSHDDAPPSGQQIFVRQQQQRNHNGVAKVMDLIEPTTDLLRGWSPHQTREPYAFWFGKNPSPQVAVALLLERAEDGEQLVVRIGSAGSNMVGFDALDCLHKPPQDREDSWGPSCDDTFEPLLSGTSLELKNHVVTVDFSDSVIHRETKYIMVDCQVTAKSFSRPPTGLDRDQAESRKSRKSRKQKPACLWTLSRQL